MARQHLGAETDAEERLVLPKWHANPVNLAADPGLIVIGAHRSTENDGTGMIAHRFRKLFAKTRPANVELIPPLCEQPPDSAGGGMLLMQDNEYFPSHDSVQKLFRNHSVMQELSKS